MEQDRAWVSQPSIANGDLSAPHFNEEATLLRARPVVPLHEVETGSSGARRLVLRLGLVAAFSFGAIAATLFYVSRQQPDAAANLTTARDNFVSGSSVAGGSVINLAEPSPSAVTEDRPVARQISKAGTVSLARKAPRVAGNAAMPEKTGQDEENTAEEIDQDQWRLLRAERREARRQRREAARSARRRVRSADDLLRIREIFEGTPRP